MFRKPPVITVKDPVLESPQSFQKGNFSRPLRCDVTRIAIGGLASLSISGFSLVLNWLVTYYVIDLHLEEMVHDTGTELTKRGRLLASLPLCFVLFCSFATLLLLINFAHVLLSIYYKRRKCYEQRDGVDFQWKFFERFSSELLLLLTLLCHDCALSVLLLALQASVTCEYLFITRTPLVNVCVVASCLSVVWKFIQLIWNAGCCGKRNDHFTSRCHLLLRIVTLLVAVACLCVASLNAALLRPASVRGALERKPQIDRWLASDELIVSRNESSMTLVSAEDLVRHHDHVLTVTSPCSLAAFTITDYIQEPIDRRQRCQLVVNTFYEMNTSTIFFDAKYHLKATNHSPCISGPIYMTSLQNSTEEDVPFVCFRSEQRRGDRPVCPVQMRHRQHPDFPDPCSGVSAVM